MVRKDDMLVARDVRFSWGQQTVLDGFSLSVPQGSVVCLMGMNGCGKSTFLDCVLGENAISAGRIEIDGRDAAGLSAKDRARIVSYVPQNHERTFPYAVRHLVTMGRTPYRDAFGASDSEDGRRVSDALALCGIAHLAERPCTALSGGEMQMVLLARALVQDTPLIVLDEPTAHLDMRNELLFLSTVERLVTHEGKTVVMATHAPDHAFVLEGAGLDVRVALMENGRVARFGVPGAVFDGKSLEACFGVRGYVAACEPQNADVAGTVPTGARRIIACSPVERGG